MTLDSILDVGSLIFVLLGALLCLTAAIGLLRFRDVPSRLHAATKPQILGLILIAISIELSSRTLETAAMLLVMVIVQMAVAPMSAHMVGRQAYRNGTIDGHGVTLDEFEEDRQRDELAAPEGDGADRRERDR